jgi:plastocyanin domain-containing protein
MKKGVGMIVLVAAMAAAAGCAKSEAATKVNKVIADDKGYTPSSVTIPKGQPATIDFTRTTDKTCAREVVFPDLNIKKDLPLNTPVAVTIPAGDAKTYAFQCGMGMFKGSVVAQ